MLIRSKPLYSFQEKVIDFAKGRERVGIFTPFGSGKSFLALQWLSTLPDPLPSIVLCPQGLVPQWGAEIEKHTDASYVCVDGSYEKRKSLLKKDADIYVVGYDAVRSRLYEDLQAFCPKIKAVIADESTRLKERRTLRWRRWYSLLKHTKYRALLTGSCWEEHPEEIFGQMLFLDDGETFSKSFMRFRYEFFVPGPPWAPYKWELQRTAPQRMAARMKNCIYIKEEELYKELPEKEYLRIELEMPMEQYRQLRDEYRTSLEGVEIDVMTAVERVMKLHELACGFVYDQGRGVDIHTIKEDWIVDNLSVLPKPLLIWSHFKYPLQRLMSKLPVPYSTQDTLQDFLDGKTDILLLSEDRGGQGLNLQRARAAIFMNSSFKAAQRKNAEARCYRIGTKYPVLYIDLVCKGTIDEYVLDVIEKKQSIIDVLLKHLEIAGAGSGRSPSAC